MNRNAIISLAVTAIVGVIIYTAGTKERYCQCQQDDELKKLYPKAFQRGILASGTVFASPEHNAGLGWL
jgi:hypothetical protein